MIRQYVDVLFIDGELMSTDTLRLYKGDTGILASVKVEKQYYRNNKLVSENVIELGKYGRAIIRKAQSDCPLEDDGIEDPVYCSDIAKIEEGRLDILIPAEAIDETSEMGIYQIQIQLYGDNEGYGRPRLTLDPFEFEACNLISEDMELEEPDFKENGEEAVIDTGLADHAILLIDDEEETFDPEGNYNATAWSSGMIISSGKLNKMENAIGAINDTTKDIQDDYATTDYVMNNYLTKSSAKSMYVAKTDIGNVDDLATKEYVDQELATISFEGLATEEYVNNAIANIDIPEVDLSEYVTNESLNNKGYVNSEWVNAQGYITNNTLVEKDYASVDYVNMKLGDIESILKSINGEDVI